MELTGKIIAVMEAKSGKSVKTGNPWKIKQLNIQMGEDLTVQFDIYARQNNGRWFNDVRAYNVIRGQIPQSPITGTENEITPFPPFPVTDGKDPGVLPF